MNSDTLIQNILKYKFEENSLLDDTNFGISQSEYICDPVNEIIREQMINICSIWIEIGVPKSRMINRIEEIKSLVEEQIVDLFKTIEKTEKTTLEELKQYRVSKLQDINKILNDLKLPLFEIPKNISLVETSKLLYFKFNELNNLKKERINKWTELKSLNSQLCAQLSCNSKPHNLNTGIPTEEELTDLQSDVLNLIKLKEKRFNELQNYKKKIDSLFVELEYSPVTDFEKMLFQEKQFILSEGNMEQLSKFLNKLIDLEEQNKLKMKKYLNKLNFLWNKLSISKTEQESLLYLFKDLKPSTLDLMKKEIEKLEEIKRQNIEIFIKKIKIEIEEWWFKCYISDEEISEFKNNYFCENNLNEETLLIFENELERLQNFYLISENIFNKYNKWKTYRTRFYELELKSKDPNRFNNRGGALLQEEKERKQLQKGISALEIEIKNLSKEWSIENQNKIFTIYGKSIEQFFNDYYETFNIVKETDLEKKKTVKKKDLETKNRVFGKSTTVANSTKKQTPLKKTPFKAIQDTKEKKDKIELVSSVPKYNPISSSKQKREILKTCNKKNIIKNLKSDLLSNKMKNNESICNFEPTLLDESAFQSGILTRNEVLNSTNVLKY